MPQDVGYILNRIAEILPQEKELLLEGVIWERRARRGFDALELTAPIAIGGVIRDGLQARLSCRSDMPNRDIHAQLQVYVSELNLYAHVQRVEWRPNAPHTNRGNAPAKLRFKEFFDRKYDFGMNRRLGIAGLRQTAPMIAEPLPRQIESFNELLAFLEELWKASGASRIPTPPWENRLI